MIIEIKEFHQVITFDPICCESCKYKIPDIAQFNNIKYNILSSLKLEGHYIILERSKTISTNQRHLIIIALDKLNAFHMNENEEIISSIQANTSCLFRIIKQKLYLCNDINAFDTLVMAKKSIILGEEAKRIYVINENTLLEISVKKRISCCEIFCMCIKRKNSNKGVN